MRKASKKLKTIEKEAREQGLQTMLVPEQVSINPRTGKLVKLRNRNTLYVFGKNGELKFQHMGGLPRTTNDRAEDKIKEINTGEEK